MAKLGCEYGMSVPSSWKFCSRTKQVCERVSHAGKKHAMVVMHENDADNFIAECPSLSNKLKYDN